MHLPRPENYQPFSPYSNSSQQPDTAWSGRRFCNSPCKRLESVNKHALQILGLSFSRAPDTRTLELPAAAPDPRIPGCPRRRLTQTQARPGTRVPVPLLREPGPCSTCPAAVGRARTLGVAHAQAGPCRTARTRVRKRALSQRGDTWVPLARPRSPAAGELLPPPATSSPAALWGCGGGRPSVIAAFSHCTAFGPWHSHVHPLRLSSPRRLPQPPSPHRCPLRGSW